MSERQRPEWPSATCPVCKKKQTIQRGKLVTHGPGKETFTCPGSGTAAIADPVRAEGR